MLPLNKTLNCVIVLVICGTNMALSREVQGTLPVP